MGKELKFKPCLVVSLASSLKPRSFSSSAVNKESTASTPARFQPATSLPSQSPPRGRAASAILPRHGPSSQWSSIDILPLLSPNDDFSRKPVYVHTAVSENTYPVVSIQYSSIRPSFQASVILVRHK